MGVKYRVRVFDILISQCSSGVEQRFCKPPVVGSNPATGSVQRLKGGIPKWPTGADCKSVGVSLRRFESCSPHKQKFKFKKRISIKLKHKEQKFGFRNLNHAGVAQLVERHPSKVNVVGSSPIARSLKPADIAQG